MISNAIADILVADIDLALSLEELDQILEWDVVSSVPPNVNETDGIGG